MSNLPYTVIADRAQYDAYCAKLEELVFKGDEADQDDIDLLTVLIEDYDRRQYPVYDKDPVALVWALLEEHQMKAADLAELLGLSKGALSNILNYRRRFTSTHIRILADRFRISQEAFNRPYPLVAELSYAIPPLPPLATAAEGEPEPYGKDD